MLWLAYRIPNLRPGILFSLFAIPQIANSSGAVPWNNFVHFGVTLAAGMFVFSRVGLAVVMQSFMQLPL